MTEELKACPFCKSNDLTIECSAVELSVRCNGCLACSPPSFESKEEIIKQWNTRPREQELEIELDNAQQTLEVNASLSNATINKLEARVKEWRGLFNDCQSDKEKLEQLVSHYKNESIQRGEKISTVCKENTALKAELEEKRERLRAYRINEDGEEINLPEDALYYSENAHKELFDKFDEVCRELTELKKVNEWQPIEIAENRQRALKALDGMCGSVIGFQYSTEEKLLRQALQQPEPEVVSDKEEYYKLVNLIKKHGYKGATKKHGCYMNLKLMFGYRLMLDTYNSAISLYNGYNKTSLGIDFGGFINKEPDLVRDLVSIISGLKIVKGIER